jgi:hypothetical protein
MKLAGGRVTDEELKKDARERQAKSRAKKKLSRPTSKPEPKALPDFRDVTETPAVQPSRQMTTRPKHASSTMPRPIQNRHGNSA